MYIKNQTDNSCNISITRSELKEAFKNRESYELLKQNIIKLVIDASGKRENDLCEKCKFGDKCKESTKIFSKCHTTICYKYEEVTNNGEIK